MNALIFTTIFLVLVGLIIFYRLREGVPGFKIMLLGINITLLGGIIALDPDSNLGGIEYLIVLSGLLTSLIGLKRKD